VKKKIIGLILIICIFTFILLGCGNKQLLDTTYTFNRAIIKLQDETVLDIEVKSWLDYDGEQLQIVAKDGTVYLTNSINCTLIKDK